MAAKLSERIQDLIGFDYASNEINTEDEALETASAEVIDMLPDELLLKYAVAPTDLTSGSPTMNIKGKKILRVLRIEGSNDLGIHMHRACEKVDIDEYHNTTQDTNSIYAPTSFSPIYTEDPESGTATLRVFPALTGSSVDTVNTAKVYYITYPTGAFETNTELDGIPNEAEHAIALKAAIYILNTMISDKVQDDEDQEMLTMLQAQQQILQQTYQVEMQRLAGEETGVQ